jgi:hypothetical protein
MNVGERVMLQLPVGRPLEDEGQAQVLAMERCCSIPQNEQGFLAIAPSNLAFI